MAVSGGGLGLSITFLDRIAGNSPKYPGLLYCSWLSLIVSIAALVLSVSTSVDILAQLDHECRVTNPPKLPVRHLNKAASWGSIVGITLLTVFSGVNLFQKWSDKSLSDNKKVLLIREHGENTVALTLDPPTRAKITAMAPQAEPATSAGSQQALVVEPQGSAQAAESTSNKAGPK
jgi:hypothetical protein